jgi:potassium efflux system protein
MSCPGGLRAQPAPSTQEFESEPTAESAVASAPEVSLGEIQRLRDQVAGRNDLEEQQKNAVLSHYDDAVQQLQAASEWSRRAEQFDQMRDQAPGAVEQLRQSLADRATDKPIDIPPDADLEDLRTRLQKAESRYSSIKAENDELMQEPANRAARRNEIPELIAEARARSQAIQQELADPLPPSVGPELAAARRIALEARSKALLQEIAALEKELLSYEARSTLLGLRQEDANRQLQQAAKRLKMLQEAVEARRRTEAEQAERQARQALRDLAVDDPRVGEFARQLAERNEMLAHLRVGPEGLSGKIEAVNAEIEGAQAELERLQEEYSRILQRIKAGGLNSAVGRMLRKQKSTLPSTHRILGEIAARRPTIAEVQVALSELRDERLSLADFEHRRLAGEGGLVDAHAEARRLLDELIQDQRQLIEALRRDYESYLNGLFELSTRQQQLVNQIELIEDYINENILWIGGTSALGLSTFKDAVAALGWFFDGDAWWRAVGAMADDLLLRPLRYALLVVLAAAWLLVRSRCLRRIELSGEAAQRRAMVDFGPSLEAFFYSAVAAAAGPYILWALGWALALGAEEVSQARCLAQGLLQTAVVWFCLNVLRRFLSDGGLAENHCGWPDRYVRPARRTLGLLAAGALPFLLLVFLFEGQPEERFKDSVGRLAFAVAMVIFAAANQRLFRLAHLATRELRPEGWLAGKAVFRWLSHVLCVGLPIALGLMALGGHYFTAFHLGIRSFWTVVLFCSVVVAVGLARRWLLLTRRRLAMDQARRRREAAQEGALGDRAEAELVEDEVDLPRIDAQTQQLVTTLAAVVVVAAGWVIWLDVIPALTYFDDVRLWGTIVPVEQEIVAEDGTTEIVVRQTMRWITAGNLGLAALIVVIMWVSVRNLPAMIEILLLQRLKMAAGERYAVLAVVRYILVAVGLVLAFNAIGMDWSSIQWLVAALGVGLGFGLQEIFANFVSGLILLFERPVRVGDTVTIGDITGRVSKIRMRATTVTDWDCKELVVPNKEFITGQLVNWSLSDDVIRVVVPVGIAYGSDTEKALAILKRVAGELPDVLADPEPQVLFLGFGASSLDFEVRVYVPGMDYLLATKHRLHLQIDQEFREAGIEIAFPQRDLHIRSGLEGVVEALRGKADLPPEGQ